MLRQRVSNGSLKEQNLRESIYDDDLQDVVDPPTLQQAYRLPPPPSNTGPCICLAFSVLAVVFLSSIASMLDANSIYIRLRTGENSKRDLAKAVRYASHPSLHLRSQPRYSCFAMLTHLHCPILPNPRFDFALTLSPPIPLPSPITFFQLTD